MVRKKKPKKINRIIGRSDKIDLPDMHLYDLDAKIDTGAYTSAIHCGNIRVEENGQGNVLKFILLDKKHPAYNKKKFEVTDFRKRIIKNSFGQAEERFIIKTAIVIFGQKFETEFSLSKRGNLKFPVLLGRKFLQKGRFMVEVTKYNLSYKAKNSKYENRDIVEKSQAVLDKEIGRSRATPGS
ncbi:MAG: RimK/LysX family protein [Chitinophagales bacterium]|nr:RimK/LysX family protein [Chitinophagales bacterium]